MSIVGASVYCCGHVTVHNVVQQFEVLQWKDLCVLYTHGRQEVYSDSPLLTLTVGRLLKCVVASSVTPLKF